MSNQIVISSGAKVRSLEGVLTGTAGIVNSVPLGGANGVATLDSSGKVPLSQLPSSVITYLGTWNAATNTPTLTNGVGDDGDLYICNVAGTVNFGAGPITFAVGDWVIYGSGTWQKSAGASGTVTSVAVSKSGDALSITGSPITTAGTINIGFAGNSGQYIDGSGNLTTFPSIITQAQNLVTQVYNETGATLTKGTVVYINGGHGNLPTITKALATSDATSAQTYGVVRADITNNNNGYVTVIGNLDNMDTQEYAAGTQLYLSSTTAGAYTSTKQYAPAHLVYVGIVTRSHPTQGVIEIKIQNGFELDELHNVSAQFPTNNEGLFYNSSNSLWENKSIATALGYTPANDASVVHLAGTETITGVKNFDVGLTLKDGIYPTPATGYIGLASNGSGLTILTKSGATVYNHNIQFQASSNDYNFPAITGIMAMLEGTQTFTGDKTFNGAVDFNNSLNINNTFNLRNNLVGSTLYTNFSILKSGSLETLKFLFSTANSSNLVFNDAANYTYTFPTITGTLALLEGTQTFSGAKTFSATTLLNTIYVDGVSYLKHQTSTSYITGYTTFSAKASGVIEYYFPSSFKSVLDFNDGADYTYTFPASSGTIALTSNLGSYVPYTGATADVNLGNTYSLSANNITAAGVLKSDFGLQLKSGLTTTVSGYLSISAQKISTNSQLNLYTDTGFYFSLIAPNTANYSYTFPAASGTLALTSNLGSYVPYTGATGNVDLGSNFLKARTIYSEGNGGGGSYAIKNGTTPSFEDGYTILSSNDYRLNIVSTVSAATKAVYFGFSGVTATRTYTLPDASGTLVLGTGTTNYLPKFTGASTIGNSLIYDNGTNVGIGTASPAQKLSVNGNIRIDGSGLTEFIINNGTNEWEMYMPSGSSDLRFYRGTDKMILTSTGNVAIGTTNTSARFNIQASANFETPTLGTATGTMGYLSANGLYGMYIGIGNSGNTWLQSQRNDGTTTAYNLLLNPNGGNVGIGTSSPATILELGGASNKDMGIVSTQQTSYVSVYDQGMWLSVNRRITDGTFSNTSLSSANIFLNGANGGSEIQFRTAAANNTAPTERMRITSGGNVLIGTTTNASNYQFVVNTTAYVKQLIAFGVNDEGRYLGQGNQISGAFQAYDLSLANYTASGRITITNSTTGVYLPNGATSWSTFSDERLKNINGTIDNALNKLLTIRAVDYSWKTDIAQKHNLGLIAQDVEKVFPQVIDKAKSFSETDDTEYLSVRYTELIPVLVAAIQEQQVLISELSAKVTALENK